MHLIDPNQSDFDNICANFRWEIPANLNIAHQVCERHQSDSDHIAVYYENLEGEQLAYSFGQLKKLSDQVCQCPIGKGN